MSFPQPTPPTARDRSDDADPAVMPLNVQVVAHTHWDREWYHPAVRFQARLVALVDALLAAPPDAATPFLLDGQTIVLADYLEIRPERARDVVHALVSGALETGPWYVLADNVIPSGEAIIRNLEAGRRWLRRMGATAPRVAYCPDSFGHPAALPLIAHGFGCDVAIVWRGFGGPSFPSVDSAWWHAPDGSRVLLYHLPPDGYEFGSALPIAPLAVSSRWDAIAATLRRRNHTGAALLFAGADHHAAQPDLTEACAQLDMAARRDGATVARSGLSQAAGALLRAAVQHDTTVGRLPQVHGELRDSYGYTWTLPGTLATRAHQKRRNAGLERAILRDVEPWLVLAWLHAAPRAHAIARDGSLTLAQVPALAAHVWETLLRTHPHDTLCGCSIDAVAADMTARQRAVAALAGELREAALSMALAHDRVAARNRAVNAAPLTVVRNRAARARSGIAELRLFETLSDVPVGPGSAATSLPASSTDLTDMSVGHCTVQRVSERIAHTRRESPQHYPDNDLVRVHHVVAWVPDVPALGVRVMEARGGDDAAPPSPVTVLELPDRVELRNGRLTLMATRQGLTIIDGERRLDNALALETLVDVGDSYTPSLRGAPESLRLRAVRIGARGPLRASVRLLWVWRAGKERLQVWTELVLDAGATHVRCEVRGRNERRNHRLQLVWRTDVTTPRVMADAALGPVERVPPSGRLDEIPGEVPPTTTPLHRWLCTHNAERGVTLFSDGLAEGEAGDARLAVTLVRAIGELSRNDLPERPGHAGWPNPIPAAQCQGRFAARVGVHLHGPWNDATLAVIEAVADNLLLPLVGESWRDLAGGSRAVAGPELQGDGLALSSTYLRDDGMALVLRAVNLTANATLGRWILPQGSRYRWRRSRLDGTPISDWMATSGTIAFDAGPREAVTVEVLRDNGRDA